jgi:DNA-binding FrmR family transcriptional regulator
MQKNKREKIAIALKKARTSIDNIIDTLETPQKNDACFDVIQQNLAVIGLLRSANVLMLETHLDGYIENMQKRSPSQQQRKMKRLQSGVIRIVQMAQNK